MENKFLEKDEILDLIHKVIDYKIENIGTVYFNNAKKDMLKEVNFHIRLRMSSMFNAIGREIISTELKKINVPEYLQKRFEELLAENLKPITQANLNATMSKVHKVVNKKLNDIIMLKTSSIMEINDEIRKISPKNEIEALKNLMLEFPEYYKEIEDSTKKLEGAREVF